MPVLQLNDDTKISDSVTTLNIQVLSFEEEKIHYVYMPSFDVTGYGNTEKEAMESLKIVLEEFLSYSINKNTLLLEMQRLGWKINGKMAQFLPPLMSQLINTNEQLKEIVNTKEYITSNYQVNLPVII